MTGRGTVPQLRSAHPLGELLPGVWLEDDFAQRWTAGLDVVLAPVFLTVDCLEAYLDPALAPMDFVTMLFSWVGAEPDETWTEQQARSALAAAVELAPRRGTPNGLVEHVRATTGHVVSVADNGGAAWSADPGAALPGHPAPRVVVTVAPGGPAVDRARLLRAVREACPAHLPVTIVAG